MDNIAKEEAIETFLEICLLIKSEEPEAAKRILAQLQVRVESHQVPH